MQAWLIQLGIRYFPKLIKFVVLGLAGLFLLMVMPLIFMLTAQFAGSTATANAACLGTVTAPDAIPEGLSDEQAANALVIVTVGEQMQVPVRGWVIAIATAIQESGLRNLGHLGDRNDHDSLGLFQQRPSQGWGTAEEIMDPEYASRKFYEKLLTVEGWESMPLTRAAQAVQISAFPDAYASHEPRAQAIVDAYTGGPLVCEGTGPVISGDVACPIGEPHGPITDSWGAPRSGGRSHKGVDIMADMGVPLYAYQPGTVRRTSSQLGGISLWITSDSGDQYYYAHLSGYAPGIQSGSRVEVGQLIGYNGSTGNSSGPHLHWEVHPGGGPPVNPTPYAQAACE